MKIAVPLDENKKDVCAAFGRAPFFLFEENGKEEVLGNPGASSQGGAGIKSAQFLVDQKATDLITFRCGENAAEVFRLADMEIYKARSTDAREQLSLLKEGKLEKLTQFHAGYHGLR